MREIVCEDGTRKGDKGIKVLKNFQRVEWRDTEADGRWEKLWAIMR